MRTRLVPWLALFGVALAAPMARAAEAKADHPTLAVRFASLNKLVADAQYLIELSGRKEEADQIKGLLDARTGPKGLDGLDTTRPMGLYGRLGALGLEDSAVVLLLPIKDEKAFLDLLERLNTKIEKGAGGVYTANLERIPFPVFFRFANGYVYATLRDEKGIAPARLADPATVLPAGAVGTASVVLALDAVPENYKRMIVGQTALRLASAKEQNPPNETPAQKAVRVAILDELAAQVRSVLTDGRELRVGLSVDRKKAELAADLTLTARPGSPLAQNLAERGSRKSLAAGLAAADSAMNMVFDLSLPKRVRDKLDPAIDDFVQRAIAGEKEKPRREVLAGLLGALKPTLKAATLDAGFDLRGPAASGHYTLVAGARVKDGLALEKAVRRAVGELPPAERKNVTLDAEKVGDTNIHKVVPDRVDADTRRLLGEGPFYFAFRDDAFLVTAGTGALEAIKQAVGVAPQAAPAARLEVAMSRLTPLLAREQKAAPEAARKAFGTDHKDDKVVAVLEGGKALHVRAAMKARLVTFFSLIEKAKTEGGR